MKKYIVLMRMRKDEEPRMLKEYDSEGVASSLAQRLYKKLSPQMVGVIMHNTRAVLSCDRYSVVVKLESLCPHANVQMFWSFVKQDLVAKCEDCNKTMPLITDGAITTVIGVVEEEYA